jgi:chloride channel 3/4/5
MNTTPSSGSEASSSSRSNASNNHPYHASVTDEPDLLAGDHDGNDTSILESDPLSVSLDTQTPLSFKRKQKQSMLSQPARLFTALTGGGTSSPRSRPSPPRYDVLDDNDDHSISPAPGLNISKDGNPLDWYVEGPGRRVGYEDMTAIDWIFEYTKERQRLRVLRSSARGLLGYAAQFADASQVWVVLVLTGLAVGAVAAGIDVTSNWLGDLKGGYCSSLEGGAFYLNKGFCCMGYDTPEQCQGWRPWSAAVGVGSVGGKWFVEYFFFGLFSVTFALAASVLVQEYAIYAKHSGIPEIKTVLGGFIIRRFMGTWTLVTKSLGLVCTLGLCSLALTMGLANAGCSVWLLLQACGWGRRAPLSTSPVVVRTCSSSCFLALIIMRVRHETEIPVCLDPANDI